MARTLPDTIYQVVILCYDECVHVIGRYVQDREPIARRFGKGRGE